MKKLKKYFSKKTKKLSSLDILGLFLIFFITASAYLFLGRKTQYLEITIRLFNHDAPEYYLDSNQPKAWYIEHIQPGKVQKSSLGENLVEITDVYSYPNGYIYNDVYVTLKLKTAKNKITQQYIYEGSPLLIHDVRTFRIQDVLISGEIIDLDKQETELTKLLITFELTSKNIDSDTRGIVRGVDNYIANLVHDGLTIKDSKNQTLVKVISVEKQPGGIDLFTPTGVQRVIDPNRTHIVIQTELFAEKINNFYQYRKEEQLIVDDSIYLTFDGFTTIGKIIAIQNPNEE